MTRTGKCITYTHQSMHHYEGEVSTHSIPWPSTPDSKSLKPRHVGWQ